MTITFLFPNNGASLSGGLKVVCQYANMLACSGYLVNIAYAGSIFWGKKTLFYKMTGIVRYLQRLVEGYSCRTWFPLDKRVKEHWCWSLNERHVPKSDIYICTSPYTAMYLKDYKRDAKRFYFIQGYENWGNVTDEMLFETYHYPLKKFAVAKWLQEVVQSKGEECDFIPNGFDSSRFKLITPINDKNRYQITMLYHASPLKGCKDSFEALNIVHKRYPQLRVNLFGTLEKPENLPSWYTYYQRPDKDTLNRIYDEAAIYMGSSYTEGWCLTIGEAMLCGCAVACTDIPGYREMVVDVDDDANVDKWTGLLSPVGDAEAMARNITRLIEDDELRWRIAENGYRNIQQYTWNSSYAKLREVLQLS